MPVSMDEFIRQYSTTKGNGTSGQKASQQQSSSTGKQSMGEFIRQYATVQPTARKQHTSQQAAPQRASSAPVIPEAEQRRQSERETASANRANARTSYTDLRNTRDSIKAKADDMMAEYDQKISAGASKEDLADEYAKIMKQYGLVTDYDQQVEDAYAALKQADQEYKDVYAGYNAARQEVKAAQRNLRDVESQYAGWATDDLSAQNIEQAMNNAEDVKAARTRLANAREAYIEQGGNPDANIIGSNAKSWGGQMLGTARYMQDLHTPGNEINVGPFSFGRSTIQGVPEEVQRQAIQAQARRTEETAARLQRESAEEINSMKAGRSELGQFGIDVAGQGVQMGLDAATGKILPGGSLTAMALRTFGSSAQEAKDAGATLTQQGLYGAGTAAVEVLTEKMFDGLAGIYGAGAADDIVSHAVGRFTQNRLGQAALGMVADAAGEGLEEVISDLANPVLRSIYDEHVFDNGYLGALDGEEILYDFLVGAAMGMVGGSVEGVAKATGLTAEDERSKFFMKAGQDGVKIGDAMRLWQKHLLKEGGYATQTGDQNISNRAAALEQSIDEKKFDPFRERKINRLNQQAASTVAREDMRNTLGAVEQRMQQLGEENGELAEAITMVALEGEAERIGARDSFATRNIGSVTATEAQHRMVEASPVAQQILSEMDVENLRGEQQAEAFNTFAAQMGASDEDLQRNLAPYQRSNEWVKKLQGNKALAADVYGTQTTVTTEEKASVKVNGETAKIVGAEDGKAIVEQNGERKTVALDDIEGIGKGYRQLVTAAANGTSGEAMLRLYNPGQNVDAYAKAWNLAENVYGAQTNISYEEARGKGLLRELTDNQLKSALELGRERYDTKQTQAKERSEQFKAAREKAKKQGTVQRKKGTVSYDGGEINGVKYKGADRSKFTRQQKKVAAMVEAMADAVNLDYMIVEGEKNTGGCYIQGGVVIININSGTLSGKTLGAATLSHELTHHLQDYAPEQYQELKDFIVAEILKQSPEQFNRMVQRQLALEPNLSYDQATDEMIANACQTMLLNSKAIEKLARQNMTLAEKITDWISETAEKIKAAFEDVDLNDDISIYEPARAIAGVMDEVQELWDKALLAANENYNAEQATGKKNTAENGRVQRMAVGYTTDNVPVAIINDNILDGVPQDAWVKTVKDAIKNRFPNGVPIGGRLIRVNSITRREYVGSHDTSFYRANDGTIYEDKLKAAGGLDDILLASTNYINEDLSHARKDNFKEFARGDVLLRIGGNDYTAKVIVGFTTGNAMVLYDVVDFQPTTLTLKSRKQMLSTQTNGAEAEIRSKTSASNKSIADESVESNTQNQQNQKFEVDETVATAMSMKQAEDMVQRAFNIGEIREWFDGEYKTGLEWLRGEGADSVALVIENDYSLQQKYLDKIPAYLEGDISLEEILDAYAAGALTGGVSKNEAKRLDTKQRTGYIDSRFYAPKSYSADEAIALYDVANQKATKSNRDEVAKARAKILFLAHDYRASELLGISQAELNKKLRSWSNYSKNALEISQRINAGVPTENRWTGIQNCSIINKQAVSDQDILEMAKEIKGASQEYQRQYIARTMLALDTHIDWSRLTFEFKPGKLSGNARGLYLNDHITIGGDGYANTVAHEMGHALDEIWGRDILGSSQYLTESARSAEQIADPEARQFFINFRTFMDSITDSADIRSAYTQRATETFARFIAKFVEFADEAAGNRFYKESGYYSDRFTSSQFIEFARLLQEKALLDSKRATQSTTQFQKWGIGETEAEQQERKESFDAIKAQNKILKARAEYWRGQTRQTKENTVRQQDTDRLANELLREYESKTDKAEVKAALKELGDWLVRQNGDSLSYDELYRRARSIAEDVIDGNYSLLDDSRQEDLNRLKDFLKGTTLNISASDWRDTGDEGFRKKYGRFFTVSENGRSLDSAWGELSAMFGEGVFPEDVYAPGDMLNMIADYLDMWKPQYGNEFEQNRGEAVEWATGEIIDRMLSEEVRQTPATYADKAQQKLNAQIAKDRERLETLRAQKNARIEQIRRQAAEKNKQIRLAEKAAKYEATAKVKRYYLDMLQRQRNRRSDTSVRGKIKALHKELTDMLLKPKEGRYVPKDLVKATAEILGAVDTTSGRAVKAKAALAQLKVQYDALAQDQKYALTYDETVSGMLQEITRELGDGSIYDLTGSELEGVYNTLKALKHTIQTANKLVGAQIEADAFEAANQMMRETENAKGIPTKALRKFVMAQMTPALFFRMAGGYVKNSMWEQMFGMLNQGQLTQTQVLMEGGQIFRELIDDKKNLDTLHDQKNLVDIGLKDDLGNSIKITRGMMLSVYMHLQNEQNARHISYGGLTVPRLRQYYKNQMADAFNGKTGRAVAFATEIAELNRQLSEAETEQEKTEIQDKIAELQEQTDAYMSNLRAQIEKQLTEYDRKWIAAAQKFFDEYSKNKLNEVTEMVYGFSKAQVDHYFPIHTDANYRAASFDTIVRDMSLENAGFMKERINGANPILLEDITDVISNQLRRTAQYVGLMPAIRNFNKAYGKARAGYSMSVQSAMARTFENEGKKYIENLMADLNGARKTEDNIFDELRGNMAGAVLTFNPRVTLAQAASFPSAAAEIGYTPLMKALTDMKNPMWDKGLQEEIAKWTPLWWYRMQGYSTAELGDIKNNEQALSKVLQKMKWATGWIQAADGLTTGGLWQASKYYVDENFSDLKKGSDEYMMKVAEVYNRVLEKTQPDYTTMQRPDILRNPNAIVKQLTMFMTQRLQNMNILYDAAATYSHYVRDMDKGRNGVTAADVKQAKTRLIWAVSSQVAASATIVIFKYFADMLMHSVDAYRDDDDELTAESVSKTLLTNFAETITSNVLWGAEAFSWLKSALTGERYYGVSLNGVDTFMDMLSDGNKLIQKLVKGDLKDAGAPAWKLTKAVAQFFGASLGNVEKFVKMIANNIEDAKNGEWGTFEAGVDRTKAQNTHLLFDALQSGDTARADRLKENFKDEKDVRASLKGYIKELYTGEDQQILKDETIKLLQQYCGMTRRDAESTALEWTMLVREGINYSDLNGEFIAGNVDRAHAIQYLQTYKSMNRMEAEAKVLEWQCEKDTGIAFGDIGTEVKTGRLGKAKAMQMVMKYGGKDEEAADKQVEGWLIEHEYNIRPSELQDEYMDGNVDVWDAYDILLRYRYNGAENAEDKALNELTRWNFIAENPGTDDITYTQVRNYEESGLAGVVDGKSYYDAYKATSSMHGIDTDGDGKSNRYTKVDQQLAYIDGMDLTGEQKTSLAIALGINEKTVRKRAPWYKRR